MPLLELEGDRHTKSCGVLEMLEFPVYFEFVRKNTFSLPT